MAHETAWAEAVNAALLGTERETPALAGDPSPLGRALDALREHGSEARLLSAAALLAGYRRAGMIAPRGATPPPPASPQGEAATCSPLAARVLMQILGGSVHALAAEWLDRASAAGCAPPAELLPALLELARRNAPMRDTVAETIGARGRWLAARNPEWAFAADVDPHGAWETGDAETRIRLLRALRRTDPAAGLALLRSTWDAEPPRERAGFLAVLEAGLGMDDEPFLEGVLDDRRKEVRGAAAGLLVQIPGSRLVARMMQRALPLLQFEPSGLIKRALGGGAAVRVELPAEPDAALKRDGIESGQGGGFGERAWMLVQILASIPPSSWSARWGVDAGECIAAARRSDDARLLVGGWTRAAVRFRDAEWAEAIIATAPDDDLGWVVPVAALLPVSKLEVLVTERLGRTGSLAGNHRAIGLLNGAAAPWSPALTRTVLRHLPPLDPNHSLHDQLRVYALRMDPAAAVAALGEHTGAWVELVHLRHTLHQAIPG